MPKQTVPERNNRDFVGQVSNMDPTDLPAGAAVVQVNASCQIPGQLRVRQGYQELRYDN